MLCCQTARVLLPQQLVAIQLGCSPHQARKRTLKSKALPSIIWLQTAASQLCFAVLHQGAYMAHMCYTVYSQCTVTHFAVSSCSPPKANCPAACSCTIKVCFPKHRQATQKHQPWVPRVACWHTWSLTISNWLFCLPDASSAKQGAQRTGLKALSQLA